MPKKPLKMLWEMSPWATDVLLFTLEKLVDSRILFQGQRKRIGKALDEVRWHREDEYQKKLFDRSMFLMVTSTEFGSNCYRFDNETTRDKELKELTETRGIDVAEDNVLFIDMKLALDSEISVRIPTIMNGELEDKNDI